MFTADRRRRDAGLGVLHRHGRPGARGAGQRDSRDDLGALFQLTAQKLGVRAIGDAEADAEVEVAEDMGMGELLSGALTAGSRSRAYPAIRR